MNNNAVYFEEQLKDTVPLTRADIDQLIEQRIKQNMPYNDLEDKSLVGDNFLYFMNQTTVALGDEAYKGHPELNLEVKKVRKSKLDMLSGKEFVRMVKNLPVFQS